MTKPIGIAVTTFGSSKPGRHRFAQCTDMHAGSDHWDRRAMLDFLKRAHEVDGCEVVACTGDMIDGPKDVLKYEQKDTRSDRQIDALRDLIVKAPKMHWAAIAGNHDGYLSSAAGVVAGRMIQSVMREAGVSWTHLGECLGRAIIHGAKVEMWHPHGGTSKRNTLRTTMNARIENTHPSERPDFLLLGHFHKFATVSTFPENVMCGPGGTFQRKGSEFANRISGEWDIGGSIVSFNLGHDGLITEKAIEFRQARRLASPWRIAGKAA